LTRSATESRDTGKDGGRTSLFLGGSGAKNRHHTPCDLALEHPRRAGAHRYATSQYPGAFDFAAAARFPVSRLRKKGCDLPHREKQPIGALGKFGKIKVQIEGVGFVVQCVENHRG
jgi:hypothetical protein